jgi:hypothetical protein
VVQQRMMETAAPPFACPESAFAKSDGEPGPVGIAQADNVHARLVHVFSSLDHETESASPSETGCGSVASLSQASWARRYDLWFAHDPAPDNHAICSAYIRQTG